MSGETAGRVQSTSGFRLITDTSGVRHFVDAGGVRQLTEEQPGFWDLAIRAGNWPGIVQFAKGILGAPEPQPAPGRGEIRTCYCGTTATVVPGVFPHRDCDGSVRQQPQPAPELAAEPELTEHVSIRFPAGMVAVAKQLAAAEGMTVSAWIRREVEREAERREQPAPELAAERDALRKIETTIEWAIDNDDDSLSLEHIRDLARSGLRGATAEPQPAPDLGALADELDRLAGEHSQKAAEHDHDKAAERDRDAAKENFHRGCSAALANAAGRIRYLTASQQPQPALDLAAAMPRVDWARVSEAVADREQERDQARAELDRLRKRFAYVAAALDSDALATQPSKKSQIQADAARRIREALA